MVRSIWVVMLAAAVSAGVVAQQAFDELRVAPSAVEGQQPPAPVPSAAPTVQAGDTRPIHVYIRSGLKSHGEGAQDAHLHELQKPADRGDAPAGHRVGRPLPGRLARERCCARPNRRTREGSAGWR